MLLDSGGRELLESLPDGIHSGLVKTGARGVFFYFQAESTAGGKQHFWKYFDLKDHRLLGVESWVAREEDPCELYFADYRPSTGRQMPHRIAVRHGDKRYAVLTIKSYQLARK